MRPLLLLPLLALAACPVADDADDTDLDTDSSDTDISDTDVAPTAVTVRFSPKVGGAAAVCGTSYSNVGTADTAVTLKDFRLFVHNVRLLVDGAAPVAITLDETSWQHDGLALLDFEDGTGPCSEFGNTETNLVVTGTVPAGLTVTGISFDVGVPESMNHLDPTTPPEPLDATGMFWVWRTGYKFLRVDLLNENEAPDNGWFVHVGAGGCMSDTPTTAPDAACALPNVASISLDGFDPATDAIALDAAALVANANVSANTASTPPGCMTSPSEPAECDPVFDALGLDFTTGLCVDGCAGQTFATVE